MTTLEYIGRQEAPACLADLDLRLWNITSTTDPKVRAFLHSTRTLDGLRELGIIPKIKMEVLA